MYAVFPQHMVQYGIEVQDRTSKTEVASVGALGKFWESSLELWAWGHMDFVTDENAKDEDSSSWTDANCSKG